MTTQKTHWQQTPNKNYLGHFDLPNGDDVTLTIGSAGWEEVKNPITKTSESKRVIHFKEKNFENGAAIKPLICNETNAFNIMKSTKQKFIEDSFGLPIRLHVGRARIMGAEVDCIRVSELRQEPKVQEKITKDQLEDLLGLLEKAKKDKLEFCMSLKIDSVADLPKKKFIAVCERLKQLIEALNGDN